MLILLGQSALAPLFYLPCQLGEVGEVAERGDGFGLGDERADAQGVEEAEVVGVPRCLGEGPLPDWLV